jgi:hypothetical protein
MKVICITKSNWVSYCDQEPSTGPGFEEVCEVIRFIDKANHDIAEDAYELKGYQGSYYMAINFVPINDWNDFIKEINYQVKENEVIEI